MKLFFKITILLTALTSPLAVQAQSIVINLPKLSWPTEAGPVLEGCADAGSLDLPVCTPGH